MRQLTNSTASGTSGKNEPGCILLFQAGALWHALKFGLCRPSIELRTNNLQLRMCLTMSSTTLIELFLRPHTSSKINE